MTLLSASPLHAASAVDWFLPWRWQARLLLLFVPSADDPRLARQRELLEPMSAGATERDLVTIEVIGEHSSDARLPGATLRLALGVPRGQFAAILVGKDGQEKLRVAAPISAHALFATIDAMPMRRDEMRVAP